MKTKKGKKHNQADALTAKKSKTIVKKVNPFEQHKNRDKFYVLERRTHHSIGQPAISRGLALEKRKQTLGAEYNLKNKTNVFQDRRKAATTTQRVEKESIYNLNDSEVLTHNGQSVAEIEQFYDGPEDHESSDEETRLGAKFTEAAHFGGGSTEERRDRKSIIDELIADSKKRKVERLRANEEVWDMTEKLDNDWKDLIPVVGEMKKTEAEKPEQDDYDRLVKEMIFAPRGVPTEKLKKEEDLAQIEKERLEKLERERLQRMGNDEDEEDKQPKHRSADDLDDGYFMESVNDDENEVPTISYPINAEENGDAAEEAEEEEGSDEDGEEEEDEESGSDDESEADSLDDLRADESEEEEEEKLPKIDDPKVLKISESKPDVQPKAVAKEKPLSKKDTEALENVPFTIAMPESYEELVELLGNHSVKVQSIIVDRVIKTNHLRLAQANRSKMIKLFAYLLQYFNDLFSGTDEETISKHFKLLNHLLPFMYDLIQMNPEEGSKCFLEVIKEKHEDYKKSQKSFPKLDTLIFFKIVGALFPTSDFRHPVATPCYVFLHHILSRARVKDRSDIAAGLFLATLVLDFQQLSKKFLPAVMNFLSGICFLGVKKTMIEQVKPLPPFRKTDMLLVFEKKLKGTEEPTKLESKDLLMTTIDDDFKVRALGVSVCLMKDFVALYDELMGMKYFIEPFERMLGRLAEEENLPRFLKTSIEATLEDFEKIKSERKFKYPEQERKNKPMIRLLEPRFETIVSDRRVMYSQATGAKAEQQKLRHMVKREFKSAKRELRRDNEFLRKVRQDKRQHSDRERQAKVKRIFSEASQQQSEYKALARTKGRKGQF